MTDSSNERSPWIKADLDLGLGKVVDGIAKLAQVILDAFGVKHGTPLNREKAQTQQADLESARAAIAVLRNVSAFIQQLRFDAGGGVRECISSFARSPTYKNASRLQEALNNSQTLITTKREDFLKFWNRPETRKCVRTDFPELEELVGHANQLKRSLYQEELERQTWSEYLPFFRFKRYRRLARSFGTLETRFDEVNDAIDHARYEIAEVIRAYQDRIRDLNGGQAG